MRARVVDRIRDESGVSVSVEVLLNVMVWVLFLVVVWFSVRIAVTNMAVGAAAADAARAASIERTTAAARTAASTIASQTLANQSIWCENPDTISVNMSGFSKDPGAAGKVSVTVSCEVSWPNVGIPVRLEGPTIKFSSTMTSPVDTWRQK
ncbi:MAG: hypothetical protein LBI99_08755 [Propionibacteriaceae bacterium]|jgi:hypothetical protein|nr:hypothetical protein [Propionibacteriaceae bacterium]